AGVKPRAENHELGNFIKVFVDDTIEESHSRSDLVLLGDLTLERVFEGPWDIAGQRVRQQGRSRNKPQTGARDARQGQQEATGCLVLSDAEVVHSGASRKWTLGRS